MGSAAESASIFRPGRNCWRVDVAAHATPLIDVRNYYLAIAEAIAKARHSVFILGWDIDSRIALLRGADADSKPYPPCVADFLEWKALQVPEINIYLLRWDYSVVFMKERETFSKLSWQAKTPPNVHISLDSTGPTGASHHQKIILVDDEIAFTGGMDIALGRWDTRAHTAEDPLREDAIGPYGPYHDMQVAVDGPVVRHFAELVRMRWRRSAGCDAVPIRRPPFRFGRTSEPTRLWPESFPPLMTNMRCAIVRTLPSGYVDPPVREVEAMYLALIQSARHFLYIENQFLTRESMAAALNARMKAVPGLRVLIVSSHNPQGIFEQEAFWGPRIRFREILEEGIPPERLRMVYPSVRKDNGDRAVIRIHAKCFICDDRYINIASSNLNNRSMGLDTECDLVFEATTAEQRGWITSIRHDLIAEHTDLPADDVARLIADGAPLDHFIDRPNRHYMTAIDDQEFTDGALAGAVVPFADPDHAIPIPTPVVPGSEKKITGRLFAILLLTALGLAALAGGLLAFTPIRDVMAADTMQNAVDILAKEPSGLPLVLLLYIGAGFILFPISVLIVATSIAFGPWMGGLLSLAGAMASAAVSFWIARIAGKNLLARFMGGRLDRITRHSRDYGILGVAAIRLMPIAPFSLVNLAAGIAPVRFRDFVIGSVLGLLPGIAAIALVGNSVWSLFSDPTRTEIILLGCGVVLWGAVMIVSQRLSRKHRDADV